MYNLYVCVIYQKSHYSDNLRLLGTMQYMPVTVHMVCPVFTLFWLTCKFLYFLCTMHNERIVTQFPWCSSICLSVRLRWACIVITWYTLAWIFVHDWIVECSRHPDTKACPPTPNRLFPMPPGREVGYGCKLLLSANSNKCKKLQFIQTLTATCST